MMYFEAAVDFYNFSVKALDQDINLDKSVLGIYKTTHLTSITLQNARLQLETAISAHDTALGQRGQLGLIHRCGSQPFRSNTKNVSSALSKGGDTLSSIATGSPPWYHDTHVPISKKPQFGVTDAKMFDKSCRGERLKVYIKRIKIYLVLTFATLLLTNINNYHSRYES